MRFHYPFGFLLNCGSVIMQAPIVSEIIGGEHKRQYNFEVLAGVA
jgi:hypothetical protein